MARIDYKKTYSLLRKTYPDMPARFEVNLRNAYEALIQEGDVAIDCGAHTGKHTLPMARAVGAKGLVYAFEANKYKAKVLSEAVEHEGLQDRVKLFAAAVGDERRSEVSFFVLPHSPGKSALILREGLSETENQAMEQISVPMVKLDDSIELRDKVAFIKTDVEGAELMALRGAAEIIRASRPFIHFECGEVAYRPFGFVSGDFYDFFDALDYVLFDITGNRIADRDDWLASDKAQGLYDYIAAPAESGRLDVLVSALGGNAIAPVQLDAD